MKKIEELKKGLIYVAFGYEYFLMAVYSAQTAKSANPQIVCEIITNVSFDNKMASDYSPFDSVIFVQSENKFNRFFKTDILKYASFDIGAYIDCDTEIRGSLEPVFKFLERYDIALRPNLFFTKKDYEIAPGLHGKFFSSWNSGVIFFRKNDRTAEFFKKWNEIYKKEEKNIDEPALACAVFSTPDLRLLSLNALWNTFMGEHVKIRNLKGDSLRWLNNTVIWHYRKPETWPYIAPEIYKIHKQIRNYITGSADSEKKEIDNTEMRYKIFSLPIYRFVYNRPVFKKIFFITLRILVNLKIIRDFNLKRGKSAYGSNYATIKN
jgi:hypothetical protein